MKVKEVYNDFLNKVLKIYKKDMYVIDNQYLLPGKYSDEELTGHTLCIINIENISELAKPSKLYFLSSVKDAKVEFDKFCKTEFNSIEEKDIQDKYKSLLSTINSINTWDELIFTDEEKNALFANGETLDLFKYDKKIPSVKISKSVFPLITEKGNTSIYYNVKKTDEEMYRLVFKYQTEYFQFFNILYYLDL